VLAGSETVTRSRVRPDALRRVRHAYLLAVVALAACRARDAAPAVVSTDTTVIELAAVGTPAPAFTVATLAGDSVTVGGPRTQAVTLVNLWSTTCGPCIAEFPDLQQLHDTFAPRGLRVVAVSTDQLDSKVRAFIMASGSTFVIGRDPTDALPRRYAWNRGLPQTLLVSADGTVRYRAGSLAPGGDSGLRPAIELALAER
jgi:peroxiredoxin